MALNSSGQISLGGTTSGQSIALENGSPGTTTISLNDSNVRSLAGVPSGQIVMPTDFWGKSNAFSFTLASGTDVNLRTAALAAGWPGSGAVQATINSGSTIQSSTTGGYALTIDGSWPGGITLINSGTIVGKGGNGGTGGTSIGTPRSGLPGSSAGTGLLVSVPVTINNASGRIAGGGGGGGGGASVTSKLVCWGGGGGGGVTFGTGGGVPPGAPSSSNGSPGTLTSGGSGGSAGGPIAGGGSGGSGGGYGSAGSSGGPSPAASGSSGGAAGNALSGKSFITFTSTGTINGAQV